MIIRESVEKNYVTIDPDRKISTAGWLEALSKEALPNSGILPTGVRWWSQSRKFWIMERPPGIVNISFINGNQATAERQGGNSDIYEIPLPWQMYIVQLGSDGAPCKIWVYSLQRSLRANGDSLFLLPLPNIYANGSVCLPHGQFSSNSIAQSLNLAYEMVWSSGANLDTTDAMEYSVAHGFPKPFVTIKADQRHSIPERLKIWEHTSLEEVKDWTFPYTNGGFSESLGLEGMVPGKDFTLESCINTFNYLDRMLSTPHHFQNRLKLHANFNLCQR